MAKTQISDLANWTPDAPGQSRYFFQQELWNRVIAENPESITLKINGVVVTLGKKTSLSGKTTWFEVELDLDTYKSFVSWAYTPNYKRPPRNLHFRISLGECGCRLKCSGTKVGSGGRGRGHFFKWSRIPYHMIEIL